MRQHLLLNRGKFIHKQHILSQLHGGSASQRKNVGSMEYSGSGMKMLRRHHSHKEVEHRHQATKIRPLKFKF